MRDKLLKGWSYDLLSRARGELMGVAMLWVMLFHAFYLDVPFAPLKWIRYFGFLGVDVFMLLSAMGLSMSLSRRKQSLGAFYSRRLVRILPAYWMVTGVYGLALRAVGRISFTVMFWTMSTLFFWTGKPNYFNWYIPALLALYLVTPLCFALMKRVRYRALLTAALSFCLFGLARAITDAGYIGFSDFAYRTPVFLLGLLLGMYIAEGRTLSLPWLCFWAAGPVVSAGLFLLNIRLGTRFSGYFLFFLAGIFLCLLTGRLMLLLPEKGLRALLRLIGESSLEIYLLNVVFVLEYDTLSRFLNIGPWHLLYYAVTIALNVALGILFHRLLDRPVKWLSERMKKMSAPAA